MSADNHDIYSIVERLRLVEANLSPTTTTKKGLTPQQKSVPQLPALFKPKTQKILGGNPNAKNPMSGYMVGSDESVEREEAMLEADMAEDVLEKVKRSFTDFIKQAEQSIDKEVQEKKKDDTDLKKKDAKDRGLKAKDEPVAEDPTEQEIPGPTVTATPVVNPTYGESAPVKSVTIKDDIICEIHGNERDGFEIRRAGRSLPTRFKNIEQAEMALEMFRARMKKQDESQDYLDEE